MSSNDQAANSAVRASGEISRDLFASEALYRREQEQIFSKAWLYVGHESQIPEPGRFILSRMGEESVIVARDRKGQVRVMLNSCRHRGMRVCRYDEGKTSSFYCPYHGWSYGLDGALKNVTKYDSEYGAEFVWDDMGLVPVAGLAIVKGLIWATWDADGPSFEDYMGPAIQMLEASFSAWDGMGKVEVLGSVQKWTVPANWKIVAENFSGDALHEPSHRSVEIVGLGPSGKEGGRRDAMGRLSFASYPGGHGGVFHILDAEARDEYAASPVTREYFLDAMKRRLANLGPEAASVNLAVATAFPNLAFHGTQPRTLMVANPLAVDKTELWRTYFVDADAPEETKRFLRKYYMRYSGPGGMTEQDDMENWSYATHASKGVIARRYAYNYQAGMTPAKTEEKLPDATIASTQTGERNARNFYAEWSRRVETATAEQEEA